VPTFERRNTAAGAKPTLAFSQISTIEGICPSGGTISSHDSFVASGSSPTRSDGPDFRCENHGSLFLLFPLTQNAHSWIEEHLPVDAQRFGNAVEHEASKFSGKDPGPANGCFSRTGADPEYDGHYSKQVLDCISQLAPPLRLATMSFLGARNGLRTNSAQSLAQLTGGEFHQFHDAKDLKSGLIALSNDIPNYYVLSFRPPNPTPGLHALHVTTKDHPQFVMKFRREYWVDDAGQ